MASISTSLDPVENIFVQLIGNAESVRFMQSGSYGLGLKITLPNDYDSPITLISLDNRSVTGASADGKIRNIFLKLVPLHSQQDDSDAWAMQSTKVPGASRTRGESPYKTIISTFIQNFETEVKTQIDLYKKTGNNLSPICPAIYFSAKLDGQDSNTQSLLDNLASNYSGNQLVDGFWDQLKAGVMREPNRKIGIILMPCFPFPPMHQAWNFFSDRDMRIGISDIREGQRILTKYFAIENYATKTTDANGNIKYILKDYTDLDTDIRRKGLFYIVQIVSHMITMYDEGVYHGDLHFGNVLINPHELACGLPLVVDSTNTTRINQNSPFVGKVYIIDFGTAVSREREMEQDESFGDKIMKILTTQGSHNFSPISYFIYDWFVSLFVLRNSTDTYLVNRSDYKPLLIEENVAKMEELVNAFMDSKRAYEGGMLSVLTSDSEKAPLIAEYREIIQSGDETSVLRGGDVYSPEIIEGTPSILESRSKMVDSQDKSFIMTDDLVNDIFTYTDNVLKEIGPQFIQTIKQSVK